MRWIAWLLAAGVIGCNPADHEPAASSSASAPVAVTRKPIELFTWWARVGESDALGALAATHQARYPQDELINASAELSGLARKTLATRMNHSEAPDTFQANVGEDLMRWVVVNGLDDRESKLSPLDAEVSNVAEWRAQVPPRLIEHMSYDGKLYAVPANVHRINCLYYNKKVLAKHGLSAPSTVDELFSVSEALAKAGVTPLAVGSREPWTLALLVFESLLVAEQGASFYTDYLSGRLEPDDPKVVQVLERAIDLVSYFNQDHARLSWLQAIELVIGGKAAMTVMGDWARVTLNASGMKLDEDYGEQAFPGTAATFVFTSDTFSLPVHAKNRAGARRLLETIGSREGQRVLNLAKGSLPARGDVDIGGDEALRDKHERFQKGETALALSGLVPSQFAEDLGQALAEMAASGDPEPVVHTLRSRYALLR